LIDEAVQEKSFLKKIFIQSNMAARPCDLSIICEFPDIPKAWKTFMLHFPSICPDVLDKIFEGLKVNPIWLPNHVT